MTNQTPDHIPPVPEGYVYGGQLCAYPYGQSIPGRVCGTGSKGWSGFEPDWMAMDESAGIGHWHIAVPATSELGRKILAERGKSEEFIVLNGPTNRALKVEQGGSTYYGTTDSSGYAVCRHEDDLPSAHKPDWDDAPGWAEWLAQDENGRWYWYESDVEPLSDQWDEISPGDGDAQWAGACAPNPNWHETLERRPAAEGTGTTDAVVNGPEPDLIIPPDLATALFDVASKARRNGYRIEWDDDGIRGWRG